MTGEFPGDNGTEYAITMEAGFEGYKDWLKLGSPQVSVVVERMNNVNEITEQFCYYDQVGTRIDPDPFAGFDWDSCQNQNPDSDDQQWDNEAHDQASTHRVILACVIPHLGYPHYPVDTFSRATTGD